MLRRRAIFRRPDSSIYVDAKIRTANETGIATTLVDIPVDGVSPSALEAQVKRSGGTGGELGEN